MRKSILLFGITAAALVAAYVFIIYARAYEKLDDSSTAWLTSKLITHRGLHSEGIPENSMSAFKASVEKGYPIELDVQLTRDEKLVVFHDKKLKRIFEQDIWLKDITYQDLSKFYFSNSKETVPLFTEVLSMVNGKVPILIEIKNEGSVGNLESILYSQLKSYKGDYAVQSFNPYSLKWFRENAPEVIRGQLSGNFLVTDYDVEYAGTTRLPWYKKFILSNFLLNFQSRPNFIAYEIKHTSENKLISLRKFNIPVIGWAVDDKEEYLRTRDYFDNFIVNTVNIK